MDYGHYFKLDKKASSVERGIVVFRYRSDDRIHVTFSADDIAFTAIDRQANSLILRIPLDESLDDSLAVSISDNFGRTTGLQPRQDIQLAQKPDVDEQGGYFTTFKTARACKRAGKPRASAAKVNDQVDAATKEPLLMRKLILDFFFDLEETRIFQMAPQYGAFLENLRDNMYARCIAAKARYYYQRAIYQRILSENKNGGRVASAALRTPETRKARQSRREFYGEIFFKTEQEWTECIRDPRSDKIFRDSNGWFAPSEEEMKRIYRAWIPVVLGDQLKKEKRANDKVTSQWFISRYAWWFPFRMTLLHGSFWGVHLMMPRLLFTIGAAWFMLLFIEDKDVGRYYNVHKEIFFGFLIFSVLTASWITLRRVLPLARGVFWRTIHLSTAVLICSSLLGRLFKPKAELFDYNFAFFWGAAAFIGMVMQLFLSNRNPSESL